MWGINYVLAFGTIGLFFIRNYFYYIERFWYQQGVKNGSKNSLFYVYDDASEIS